MKLVLAITGASGAIYPRIFLEQMQKHPEITLYVVASVHAQRIFKEECGKPLSELVTQLHPPSDFDVPYVSGSTRLDAMIILPCSMGTLGRIACGISNDAITRAADVFLKERRQIILVPRETPFSLIHLENMQKVAQAGAMILPANPTFYGHPATVDEVAGTVVARIMDQLGLKHNLATRWCAPQEN